jgi:hypothetical protein
VSVGVKTVAGQVDVSQQLLDRSQPGIDQILFADLRADYNVRLDLQALIGSGSGANAKGVLSDANRIQVTYTDASPTVGELYSKIAGRLAADPHQPGAAGGHDRRAPAPLGAGSRRPSDTTGRPLISRRGRDEQPRHRRWHRRPRPSRLPDRRAVGGRGREPADHHGAGTNEDIIIVMRASDVMLAERPNPTTRAHDQVLDANLAVRLQLYNYFAFTTERYSKAVATIGGTGLVAPTF